MLDGVANGVPNASEIADASDAVDGNSSSIDEKTSSMGGFGRGKIKRKRRMTKKGRKMRKKRTTQNKNKNKNKKRKSRKMKTRRSIRKR